MQKLADFQKSQFACKDAFKDKLRRLLNAVDAELTDEDVDRLFEGGQGDEALRSQMISGQVRARRGVLCVVACGVLSLTLARQVDDELRIARERHQDIVELERSIRELHQMTIDFAFLVDQQSELLDHIEGGQLASTHTHTHTHTHWLRLFLTDVNTTISCFISFRSSPSLCRQHRAREGVHAGRPCSAGEGHPPPQEESPDNVDGALLPPCTRNSERAK
jgi:hypothetical protein